MTSSIDPAAAIDPPAWRGKRKPNQPNPTAKPYVATCAAATRRRRRGAGMVDHINASTDWSPDEGRMDTWTNRIHRHGTSESPRGNVACVRARIRRQIGQGQARKEGRKKNASTTRRRPIRPKFRRLQGRSGGGPGAWTGPCSIIFLRQPLLSLSRSSVASTILIDQLHCLLKKMDDRGGPVRDTITLKITLCMYTLHIQLLAVHWLVVRTTGTYVALDAINHHFEARSERTS